MRMMWRTRRAYSASHGTPQHSRVVPAGVFIGKPSLTPSDTTAAVGRRRRTWAAAIRGQSALLMAVPGRTSLCTIAVSPSSSPRVLAALAFLRAGD